MAWLLASALMLVGFSAAASLLLGLPVAVAAESLAHKSPAISRRFWLVAACLPPLVGLALTGAGFLTLAGDLAASPHQDRLRAHFCLQTLSQTPDAAFRFQLYAWIAVALLAFAVGRLALSWLATSRLGVIARRHSHDTADGGQALVLQTDQADCFTVGLLDPVIVSTSALRQLLDPEEYRAVMAHEAAHGRHRDAVAELLLRLATEALLWVPTTHYYRRQARTARELACDQAAAAATSTAALSRALAKMAAAQQAQHRQAEGDLSRLRPASADYADPQQRRRALEPDNEGTLAAPLGLILVIESTALAAALLWLRQPLHDTLHCVARSLLGVLGR